MSAVEPYSLATLNYLQKYKLLPHSTTAILPSTCEEEEEEEEEEPTSYCTSASLIPARALASPFLHDARIRGMRKLQ